MTCPGLLLALPQAESPSKHPICSHQAKVPKAGDPPAITSKQSLGVGFTHPQAAGAHYCFELEAVFVFALLTEQNIWQHRFEPLRPYDREGKLLTSSSSNC